MKINSTLQRLAWALCWVALIGGCALKNNIASKGDSEGLVPAGQIATTISGIGHYGNGIGIPEFYVNNTWGGSAYGWGGGGRHVCCIALRDTPKQPVMVTVKWKTYRSNVDERRWHEATVPIHFSEKNPGDGGAMVVHFLPGA